jgi:hypothetical protein
MRQAVAQKAGHDGSSVPGLSRRMSIRHCSVEECRISININSPSGVAVAASEGEATMR